MSKHNHNTYPSTAARCKCGRYITLGEEHAGVNTWGYKCPDCKHREYQERFNRLKYTQPYDLGKQ